MIFERQTELLPAQGPWEKECHRVLRNFTTSGAFQSMADDLAPQHAFAVNHVRFRPSERPIDGADRTLGVAQGQEIDTIVFQEAVIRTRIFIYAHRHHGHAFVLQAFLHANQGRRLFYARRTPRRPESEDHHLSTELTQGDLVVGVLESEVDRLIPDMLRARPVVTARQKYGNERS